MGRIVSDFNLTPGSWVQFKTKNLSEPIDEIKELYQDDRVFFVLASDYVNRPRWTLLDNKSDNSTYDYVPDMRCVTGIGDFARSHYVLEISQEEAISITSRDTVLSILIHAESIISRWVQRDFIKQLNRVAQINLPKTFSVQEIEAKRQYQSAASKFARAIDELKQTPVEKRADFMKSQKYVQGVFTFLNMLWDEIENPEHISLILDLLPPEQRLDVVLQENFLYGNFVHALIRGNDHLTLAVVLAKLTTKECFQAALAEEYSSDRFEKKKNSLQLSIINSDTFRVIMNAIEPQDRLGLLNQAFQRLDDVSPAIFQLIRELLPKINPFSYSTLEIKYLHQLLWILVQVSPEQYPTLLSQVRINFNSNTDVINRLSILLNRFSETEQQILIDSMLQTAEKWFGENTLLHGLKIARVKTQKTVQEKWLQNRAIILSRINHFDDLLSVVSEYSHSYANFIILEKMTEIKQWVTNFTELYKLLSKLTDINDLIDMNHEFFSIIGLAIDKLEGLLTCLNLMSPEHQKEFSGYINFAKIIHSKKELEYFNERIADYPGSEALKAAAHSWWINHQFNPEQKTKLQLLSQQTGIDVEYLSKCYLNRDESNIYERIIALTPYLENFNNHLTPALNLGQVLALREDEVFKLSSGYPLIQNEQLSFDELNNMPNLEIESKSISISQVIKVRKELHLYPISDTVCGDSFPIWGFSFGSNTISVSSKWGHSRWKYEQDRFDELILVSEDIHCPLSIWPTIKECHRINAIQQLKEYSSQNMLPSKRAPQLPIETLSTEREADTSPRFSVNPYRHFQPREAGDGNQVIADGLLDGVNTFGVRGMEPAFDALSQMSSEDLKNCSIM